MQGNWKAGVARTIITPAEPMWLAGWAVRNEPARGTLADLYARALAFEDQNGGRLVLVTVDLIAVSQELTLAVAEQAARRWRLPRERLLLCASHTHSGPEIRPDKIPFFHIPVEYARKIEPYVDWLVVQLVALIDAAIDDLQPGSLSVHETTVSFAHNRRGAGTLDHGVPVLQVKRLEGRGGAILFGYACHNTTMSPEDGRYCGDYAGFAQAELEADGETVALFVAGAGADQDPEPRGTVEFARQHGQGLATAVRSCLADSACGRPIDGSLRVGYAEVPLEFQPLPPRITLEANRLLGHLPARTKAEYLLARLNSGEGLQANYACPLHVVGLGPGALLIGLGGEPVIDYADELKRRYRAPGRVVWVIGYANDMFGYLPSARVLREGGYEGNRSLLWSALPSPFTENAEATVLNGVDRLVHQIQMDVQV